MSYLYNIGKLREYFESISREGCTSRPNYIIIARVKRGYIELLANRLREKCNNLKILESTVFKCSKGEALLTLLVKNGRLVIDAPSEDEAFRILGEILE